MIEIIDKFQLQAHCIRINYRTQTQHTCTMYNNDPICLNSLIEGEEEEEKKKKKKEKNKICSLQAVYLHTSNSTDTFLPSRDSLASKPGLLLSTTSKHTNYEGTKQRVRTREAIEEKTGRDLSRGRRGRGRRARRHRRRSSRCPNERRILCRGRETGGKSPPP